MFDALNHCATATLKQVLTVRNVVEVYETRMSEFGVTESRDYKSLRKLIVRAINKHIPDVCLEQSLPNQSQRITTKNMENLILRLAENKCNGDEEEETEIPKKAASILRRRTLVFMKENPVNFYGSVKGKKSECPEVLSSFLKWSLSGDRRLSEILDVHLDVQSRTASDNVMYNMKTKRQLSYKPRNADMIRPRRTFTPSHHIGLGLCLRNYDRNDTMLKLLSTPNYGLCITPRQCLRWETSVANSVIDNMTSNENVYVPPNLVKNVLPMFHIDNIDWLED